MSFAIDLTKITTKLRNGEISYKDFLDLTDPGNPDSVYAETLGHLQKIVNSSAFNNASAATRNLIKNEMDALLGYSSADSSAAAPLTQLYQSLGIDPAALRLHRSELYIRTPEGIIDNHEVIAALDFSKGGPGNWTVIPSAELLPENMAKNGVVQVTMYDAKGLPGERTIIGFQPDKNKQLYQGYLPNVGVFQIDKRNVTPNITNLSAGGPQFGVNATYNPITGQNDIGFNVVTDQGAYNQAREKASAITTMYSQLLGAIPSETWVMSKIRGNASLDQVQSEITNSEPFILRGERGLNMSPAPIGNVAPPLASNPMQPEQPQNPNMSRAIQTPAPPQQIGIGGPGSLPQASQNLPNQVGQQAGLPSLADVRNVFRRLRV